LKQLAQTPGLDRIGSNRAIQQLIG